MAVRIFCALVLVCAATPMALGNIGNVGYRIALRVFEDCSKSEGLSPCLKKKALTFLDRLGRMDKLDITEEISIVTASNVATNSTPLTEEQIDNTLPRGFAARDEALTDMLWNKANSVVRSKNIEFTTSALSDIGFEEAREGGNKFGGNKKIKIGKKKGGMLMMLLMGALAKMMGLVPIGIAGLFLLAGKALITSKIALLLSGIIAIKKLVAAKQGGGGGSGYGGSGHGGGYGGGYGGGGGGGSGAHHVWASSGGGWDKRSFDESHKLAYNSYTPK